MGETNHNPSLGTIKVKKQTTRRISLWIPKVCVNIFMGGNRDRLSQAARVLEQPTGQTTVFSKAKYTIRHFGIRINEKGGKCFSLQTEKCCSVCGAKTEETLEDSLKLRGHGLRKNNFSKTGNFGFGTQEFIDLGIRCHPTICIYGLDFYVVVPGRPAMSIRDKKCRTACIGAKHRISNEEAIHQFQQKYDGIILPGKYIPVSERPIKVYSGKKKTISMRLNNRRKEMPSMLCQRTCLNYVQRLGGRLTLEVMNLDMWLRDF
ncbi:large ribosomal subunit protein uL5-like [Tenrec ecaudatus]|uniref:large ribosomal subunit protein uL5-like n=1 Tax=Tenrec ecaudatus TaxID=94439 RepID=UPI003F5A7AEA